MTRRDWWLGIGLLVVGLLFQALFPRYEVLILELPTRPPIVARVDRWTGTLERTDR